MTDKTSGRVVQIDHWGIISGPNTRKHLREETIGPCPCPRWGHPWRLNTFITRLDSQAFTSFISNDPNMNEAKIPFVIYDYRSVLQQ